MRATLPSVIDLTLPTGRDIPIEERPAEAITEIQIASEAPHRTAPTGIKTYDPAFDITPAALITALITDRGVISPVNADTMHATVGP